MLRVIAAWRRPRWRGTRKCARSFGRVTLLAGLLGSCSGQTEAHVDRFDAAVDAMDVTAPEDQSAGDALAPFCTPGSMQDCELGRRCPGTATCLDSGLEFGLCACATCPISLPPGKCSWREELEGIDVTRGSIVVGNDDVRQTLPRAAGEVECSSEDGWYSTPDGGATLCPETCTALPPSTSVVFEQGCWATRGRVGLVARRDAGTAGSRARAGESPALP